MRRTGDLLGAIHTAAVLFCRFAPLAIMGGAPVNDSRLPSVRPWKGWTWPWSSETFADG